MKIGFWKKGFVLGIFVLLVGAIVIPSTVGIIEKKTPFIGQNSRGYIQDLIDNASNGDTIYIPSGTYYESIIIDKPINLVGEDRDTTIIDGSGSGDVVKVTADWVNISGFTIRNSEISYSGIDIISNNNTIIDSSISNNWVGIWVKNSQSNTILNNNFNLNNRRGINLEDSNSNTITSNNISNNKYGITLNFSYQNIITGNTVTFNYWGIDVWDSSTYNTITGNTISNNDYYGIYLYGSSRNNITDNTISNNEYGIIQLYFSNYNTITGNTISDNDEGIYLHGSSTTISGNTISNNNEGIYLTESRQHIITGNTISNNGGIGIYIQNSDNNNIYHNNFIANTDNAYDEGDNSWDDGYPSAGNYWDDYIGEDNYHGQYQDIQGHDRIGDTPYVIQGVSNQDNYPVIHPNGWLNEAPENIKLDGPTSGKQGEELTFNTSAIDPEDDPIYYKFDWGDNTTGTWRGPHSSGTNASDSHSWIEGKYNIRVKAKDTRGLETDWSDVRIVTITRPFDTNKVILIGLIINLDEYGDFYTFNSVALLWLCLKPFNINFYSVFGEEITILKEYQGLINKPLIFGYFDVVFFQ